MKKLLKIAVSILAFTLIVYLAGCTAKKAISGDEFEKIMEDEGISFKRFQDSNGENICADQKDPLTLLWFYICDSENYAKDFFDEQIDNQEDFMDEENSDMEVTAKRSGDYEKVTYRGEIMDDHPEYIVYIRVKKTVLIITTDCGSKSDVKRVEDIVSKMGY